MEINRGNYKIDTEERFERYMKARAFRNEAAFYEYRKNWEKYPQEKFVSEYPLSLEFQISDVCNLKCAFCYRGQPGYVQNKKGFMDFSLFKKAIDEVGDKVPAIRFNSSGESVLHPQFLEMVKYAKDRGALEVSFITNLGAIDLDKFEKILLAGVDWMTVSVDGMYEEYEKRRYPLKFQEIYQRLADIKAMKERYHTLKPAINIQGIWPFIENDIEEYLEKMSLVSDYINYNAYIDMANPHKKGDYSPNEPEFTCPEPYQRMIVHLDGNVFMCCGVVDGGLSNTVGNLYADTVYNIWHSKEMEKIRELCSMPDGYKQIESCQKCFAPRKMIEKEVSICGEKRIIKEYV